MDLWLRYREGQRLAYDECVSVGAQDEWKEHIHRSGVIGSVLWRADPVFVPAGPSYRHRRHPHERGYRNDSVRNASYLEGCRRLAARLCSVVGSRRALVYAPLRGALPIWRAVSQFLPTERFELHLPVTSSFVLYPAGLRIFNRKGRPASGRFTHILELRRLRPMLPAYDVLVYVDEIVSGNMMSGHIKDMVAEGIDALLPIVACGLADDQGRRSPLHREKVARLVVEGRVEAFLWEGCDTLITEDQRYLLGMHYVDNAFGPHAVPMLTPNGAESEEKRLFEEEVLTNLAASRCCAASGVSRLESR